MLECQLCLSRMHHDDSMSVIVMDKDALCLTAGIMLTTLCALTMRKTVIAHETKTSIRYIT